MYLTCLYHIHQVGSDLIIEHSEKWSLNQNLWLQLSKAKIQTVVVIYERVLTKSWIN